MSKLFKPKTIALMLTLLIFSCGSTQGQQSEITVVDADRLIRLQADGAIVIDVRTSEEVANGKIPGAIHVPISDNMASELTNINKDQPVIVYCQSGGRSSKASLLLQKAGYTTIYNYSGSMNDWEAKKKPLE